MQNQHVTSFPNPEEYPGIPQENGIGAFGIDPALEAWPPAPEVNQYNQSRYTTMPQQYYHPSFAQEQQQSHQQQPAFQNYPAIGQSDTYGYQPPANQYSEPYYGGQTTQNNFANNYDFPAQPSQHETISPQALQVENRIGNAGMNQNAYHNGDLGQRQVFDRNVQQARWTQERLGVDSANQFSDLINGNATSNHNRTSRQPSSASLEYSQYNNAAAVNRAGGVSNSGFDSGLGNSSSLPPRKPSVPASRPNPLRVTHQGLLDQYPEENDATHRVVKLPFAVLGENVTELEIRGKTTVPKYKARGGSIGNNFAPRTALFATRSAPVTAKKPRAPKKPVGIKPKKLIASRPSVTAKDNKARVAGARVFAKQGSPTTPSLESDIETTSEEEDSEEESEEEEAMGKVWELSEVRSLEEPTDPVELARWEAIGIVFKQGVKDDLIEEYTIREAFKMYEPFISKLRDNYRSSVLALQEATKQKRQAEISRLTQAKLVNDQALVSGLQGTLDHGHVENIKNLGTNPRNAVALANVLSACVKADDYTGELPLKVLELMAKFTTMTTAFLKELKFEGLQKRFMKKGTDKMKGYLAQISRNATARDAQLVEIARLKTEDAKYKSEVEAAILKAIPQSSAGIKRPHEGGDANGNPAKKIASGIKPTLATRQPVTTAKPTPQPNFFASLTRSSKPSQATSTVAKPAPKSTIGVKRAREGGDTNGNAPKKPAVQPSSTRMGISAMLKEIDKPTPAPKAPVIPEGPPETPEEKKKRERKESRRHLRVKWREGDELRQVRIFTQVEGEDEGRKDELVRDAHDDRSEGMMHKQRAQEEVDIDEDDASGEIEYRPYPAQLCSVDFSDIDQAKRRESYVTRGGEKTFSTPQQEIQNRHESTELMVVYTDPSDIPHSAKEPPVLNDEFKEEKLLVQPQEQWFHQRNQEIHLYGVKRALQFASSRLRGQLPNQHPNISNHQTFQQQHQFALPAQNHGRAEQSYNKPAMSSNDEAERNAKSDALFASIMEKIKPIIGKPFPAREPPVHLTQAQAAEWIEGYNRDQALKANSAQQQNHVPAQQSQVPQAATQQPQFQAYQQPNMSSAQVQAAPAAYDMGSLQNIMNQLRALAPQAQVQQPHQYQQQPLQQTAAPAPAAAAPVIDWSTWMQQGGFGAQQAPQQQAPQQQHAQAWPGQNTNGFNFGGAAANPAMYNGGVNDTRYTPAAANQNWGGLPSAENNWGSGHGENKQWDSNNNNNGNNQYKNYRGFNDRGGDGATDRNDGGAGNGQNQNHNPNRKVKHHKAGTRPCKFFQEGKCAKGDKCTYLHT